MTAAITAHHLTKRFGPFTAVDDITFAVEAGEIFGFLGPNGAGKTTTIKMLTALTPPTTGEVTIAGHDLAYDPHAIKPRLGYMSQLFSLYGDLSVEENIQLFGGLYGLTGSRLAARRASVLRMANLETRSDQPTAALPLGWKQRLALGCAVLHEPDVLFLDEPTSGVDPVARRGFWDLIHDLARAGTTVVVSTHYMEEAEYCDRLGLMNRGRLVAVASPADLRRGMPYSMLAFRADRTANAAQVAAGNPAVLDAAMFGREVRLVVEDETIVRKTLPGRLAAAGIASEALRSVAPTLEDVFVTAVRESGGVVAV